MDMKVDPSFLQLILDIFFDTLGYILPASILFTDLVTLLSPLSRPLIEVYLSLNAAFDRFVVILLGLGILYTGGQFLTHFSYEVILRPLRKPASMRNDESFIKSDIEWTADYTFIRHTNPALGVAITKRYARMILSRNNAPVLLLLVITSLISSQWIPAIVTGALCTFSSPSLWGTGILHALPAGSDAGTTEYRRKD